MPPTAKVKRSSTTGRFGAGSETLHTRKGKTDAAVRAVQKDRSLRVAKALKAASEKTGIFRS
jgi:hypothetical protein